MRAAIRNFIYEEDATILVLVSLSLVVFVGMVAITVDLGRMAAAQGDLQGYADAVALAAAGELKGTPDAVTNAIAAAEEIRDRQLFADGTRDLIASADVTLNFLFDLPPLDTQPLTGYYIDPVEEPERAVFVEAIVTPRNVSTNFANALFQLTGGTAVTSTVGATAVAGWTYFACDIAPLFFCLPTPAEGTDTDGDGIYGADENIGRTIELRAGGNGAGWQPGNFGFLDPSYIFDQSTGQGNGTGSVDENGPCAGLSAKMTDVCLVAASGNLTQCFAHRYVQTRTGQAVGIWDRAYNMRFDMFTGDFKKLRNNSHYWPGPHVVSGYDTTAADCMKENPSIAEDPAKRTLPFPVDDCFLTVNADGSNACDEVTNPAEVQRRFGDGDWSQGAELYFQTNYGVDATTGLSSFGDPATRWELFQAEISASIAGGGNDPIVDPTVKAESGLPKCASDYYHDLDFGKRRRTFVAAGVNCDPGFNGQSEVTVEEYFKLFQLQPVGFNPGFDNSSPPGFKMYFEIIGSASEGGGGNEPSFHEQVVLYR